MAPFRRFTDPIIIPVGPQPSNVLVADASGNPYFPDTNTNRGYNAFYLVNKNACYVRLRGASGMTDLVAGGQGWLFPPGFAGVLGTQRPLYVSVMAEDSSAHPLAAVAQFQPLEMSYGRGDDSTIATLNAASIGGGGGAVVSTLRSGAGAYQSISIGSDPANPTPLLGAVTARAFLDIKNEDKQYDATLFFGTTPFTVAAGYAKTWEGSYVPADAISAVSLNPSGAKLTIGAA